MSSSNGHQFHCDENDDGIHQATRNHLVEMANDRRLLFYTGFDECIIGLAERCGSPPRVTYDGDAMLALLVSRYGMDVDAAEEHFEINVMGSHVGPYTPVIVFSPPGTRITLASILPELNKTAGEEDDGDVD